MFSLIAGMSLATSAEAVEVMDKASTDGSFIIAQTNGMLRRQDRRDTRQDCRQQEGLVGADKRGGLVSTSMLVQWDSPMPAGKKRLPMGKRVQPAPAGGCAQAIKRFHPDDRPRLNFLRINWPLTNLIQKNC